MVVPQSGGGPLEFIVHLGQRDIAAPPSVQLEVVLVVHGQAFGGERDGHPQLEFRREVIERLAHHAHDLVRHTVHPDRLADHCGIGPVATLPQPMAEDHDLRAAGLVLVVGEGTAVQHGHAEHREVAGRHTQAHHALGRLGVGQVEAGERACGEVLQRARALSQVVEVAGRRVAAPLLPRRVDVQHTLRLGKRKGLQYHRMDHAEDGGRRTDAQCEGEHRGRGEAGLQPALAQCEADVLCEFGQPLAPGPRPVASFTETRERGRQAVQPTFHLGPRRLGRPSAVDELIHSQLTVVRQLVAHFLLDGHSPQEGSQSLSHGRLSLFAVRSKQSANRCSLFATRLSPLAGVEALLAADAPEPGRHSAHGELRTANSLFLRLCHHLVDGAGKRRPRLGIPGELLPACCGQPVELHAAAEL